VTYKCFFRLYGSYDILHESFFGTFIKYILMGKEGSYNGENNELKVTRLHPPYILIRWVACQHGRVHDVVVCMSLHAWAEFVIGKLLLCRAVGMTAPGLSVHFRSRGQTATFRLLGMGGGRVNAKTVLLMVLSHTTKERRLLIRMLQLGHPDQPCSQ